LKGTDLDPSDDVPIKISNYEYHIPKGLVPYFGGGKKYLDKIRNEGLALRKRLEEEKQPSMQEQQPMEAAPEPAPAPQPQMVADAQPAPQMPMMQTGGFVNDPAKAIKSAEQALTSDASQPAQSAYNQIQALERARRQNQQPPMIDPSGRVVQQGFAAPQGFMSGTPKGGIPPKDLAQPREEPSYGPDPQAEVKPETQEEPVVQSETSSSPAPQQQRESSEFDKAFAEAIRQGKSKFEFQGKSFNTQKRDDVADFQKLKTLEIEKVMALTALAEAQKEGRAGMQAVMHVINNRTKAGRDKEFGVGTIPGEPHRSVILHPNAFTALRGYTMGDPKERKNFQRFMDIKFDNTKFIEAVEDAKAILNGEMEDSTGGSLFYFNPKTVEMPKHLRGLSRRTIIGNHHFYNQGGFVERVIDSAA